jgi:hypothetical protein
VALLGRRPTASLLTSSACACTQKITVDWGAGETVTFHDSRHKSAAKELLGKWSNTMFAHFTEQEAAWAEQLSELPDAPLRGGVLDRWLGGEPSNGVAAAADNDSDRSSGFSDDGGRFPEPSDNNGEGGSRSVGAGRERDGDSDNSDELKVAAVVERPPAVTAPAADAGVQRFPWPSPRQNRLDNDEPVAADLDWVWSTVVDGPGAGTKYYWVAGRGPSTSTYALPPGAKARYKPPGATQRDSDVQPPRTAENTVRKFGHRLEQLLLVSGSFHPRPQGSEMAKAGLIVQAHSRTLGLRKKFFPEGWHGSTESLEVASNRWVVRASTVATAADPENRKGNLQRRYPPERIWAIVNGIDVRDVWHPGRNGLPPPIKTPIHVDDGTPAMPVPPAGRRFRDAVLGFNALVEATLKLSDRVTLSMFCVFNIHGDFGPDRSLRLLLAGE